MEVLSVIRGSSQLLELDLGEVPVDEDVHKVAAIHRGALPVPPPKGGGPEGAEEPEHALRQVQQACVLQTSKRESRPGPGAFFAFHI